MSKFLEGYINEIDINLELVSDFMHGAHVQTEHNYRAVITLVALRLWP